MMDGRILLNGLKGAGIALLLALALLLPAAAILLKLPDPEAPLLVVTHLLQLVSAGIGGAFASRFQGEKGVLVGILSGLFLAAFLLVGSLITAGGDAFFTTLLCSLGMVAVAGLGGFLGAPKGKSNRRRRKDMMKRLR